MDETAAVTEYSGVGVLHHQRYHLHDPIKMVTRAKFQVAVN